MVKFFHFCSPLLLCQHSVTIHNLLILIRDQGLYSSIHWGHSSTSPEALKQNTCNLFVFFHYFVKNFPFYSSHDCEWSLFFCSNNFVLLFFRNYSFYYDLLIYEADIKIKVGQTNNYEQKGRGFQAEIEK